MASAARAGDLTAAFLIAMLALPEALNAVSGGVARQVKDPMMAIQMNPSASA
jgi:hypothetical protein